MKSIAFSLVLILYSLRLVGQNISGEWIGEGSQPGSPIPNSKVILQIVQNGRSVSGTKKSYAIDNPNIYCVYSFSGTFDGKTLRFSEGAPVEESTVGNIYCCHGVQYEFILKGGNTFEGSGKAPNCLPNNIVVNKINLDSKGQSQLNPPIKVCYIPDTRCTATSSFDCGYTFDGGYMLNTASPKLQNHLNFGPGGIVDCEIYLVPVLGTISVPKIESTGCNIFFVGGFGGVECAGYPANQIPSFELDAIREWSMKSDKNLAIVTQVNAINWGYKPSNGNTNPGKPTYEGKKSIVFNGPFGSVENFSQGGCYQGGYAEIPKTGAQILSTDSSPIPKTTIALDKKTNDIIVADVDIFTSLGGISTGPRIINNNDILFANIFASACSLVKEPPTTTPTNDEVKFVVVEKEGIVNTLIDSLNFRSEPRIKSSNLIRKIPSGSKLYVLGYEDIDVLINGEYNKWYKVRFEGRTGWAWGKYILFNQPKLPTAKSEYDDLPRVIDGIAINYQKTVTVKNREITIYPFDNEKEDGDTVSININGVWARDHLRLRNKKANPTGDDVIKCYLNGGNQNYIISRAWNLGSIGLNTLTIRIDDGISVQEVLINSEIGLSGGIRIICDK